MHLRIVGDFINVLCELFCNIVTLTSELILTFEERCYLPTNYENCVFHYVVNALTTIIE